MEHYSRHRDISLNTYLVTTKTSTSVSTRAFKSACIAHETGRTNLSLAIATAPEARWRPHDYASASSCGLNGQRQEFAGIATT